MIGAMSQSGHDERTDTQFDRLVGRGVINKIDHGEGENPPFPPRITPIAIIPYPDACVIHGMVR